MKKLINIILLLLFAISLFFSISNNINTSTSKESQGYASIIPMPPPNSKPGRGCWYLTQILLSLGPQQFKCWGFLFL